MEKDKIKSIVRGCILVVVGVVAEHIVGPAAAIVDFFLGFF